MFFQGESATADIIEGFRLWRYWLYRALLTYKSRYSNTRLGLTWPAISLLLVVSVLGSIWGIVLDKDNLTAYLQYLVAGFAIWQFLSGAVNQGNRRVSGLGGTSSITVVILERWAIIVLAFLNVLPIVLVAMFFGPDSYEHLLYLPLGILTLILWSIGVMLIVLVLVTLFPDMRQLVQSVMRLAFLATPIIWAASRLGEYKIYLWLNPFFPPLEVMRYAITGQTYMLEDLSYAFLYALILFLLGITGFISQYSRLRARIV